MTDKQDTSNGPGVWAKDALVRRVLMDAIRATCQSPIDLVESPAPSCAIVVAEGPVPDAVRQAHGTIVPVEAQDRRLGTVLARLLRAQSGTAAARGVLQFGHFTLDMAQMLLTDEETDASVNLTEKERDILARLHREQGRTLDRRVLLEDVWGYAAAVETHTLETHIYRLRQKLERDPAAPQTLITDEIGYRLIL